MLLGLNIDPARLEFFNLSAAQGPRWAEICTEFTDRISKLGPSPVWFALQSKKKEPAAQAGRAADDGMDGALAVDSEQGVDRS